MTELVVEDLTFSYRKWKRPIPTLDGISLTAGAGEVHGLLGHNGAGKSTLLTLVAGLLRPGAGSIRLDGRPVHHREVLRESALVTERVVLYDRFTALDTLRVYASARGLKNPGPEIDRAAAALNLTDQLDKKVGQLSTGLRKRLAISMVLLDTPPLLLIDEPFAGVDPVSLDLLLAQIRAWADEGRAVVLASHDLPELETVASHVHVFQEGRLLLSGRVDELTRPTVADSVVITTAGGSITVANDAGLLAAALADLEQRGEVVHTIASTGADTSLAALYRELHATPSEP